MIKVLFVCLGNICRSPMAEGIFKFYAEQKGVANQFLFESRAISRWEEGNPPHPGTMNILKRYPVDMNQKKSKMINEIDFIKFDYIIGMDETHINFLKRFNDGEFKHKVYKFHKKDVEDPYYTNRFEDTHQMILNQVEYWFDRWLKKK